ncbi:hypothetical protein GN958_ATG02235 [Phytophthora infestans]|uniref:Uncharacterized protein n=1 Tax=Phytophthora infestans TaxID=4787 RepID=A0A8S9V6W2_PHYIN|nr:hypothetical protein GN958_ATG02235 [Phytophthora infestans]
MACSNVVVQSVEMMFDRGTQMLRLSNTAMMPVHEQALAITAMSAVAPSSITGCFSGNQCSNQ